MGSTEVESRKENTLGGGDKRREGRKKFRLGEMAKKTWRMWGGGKGTGGKDAVGGSTGQKKGE